MGLKMQHFLTEKEKRWVFQPKTKNLATWFKNLLFFSTQKSGTSLGFLEGLKRFKNLPFSTPKKVEKCLGFDVA